MSPTLCTPRLLLRPWRDADREPFAAMNADPEVMEHFVATQDRAASDATADRIEQHHAAHGFGLWAVEVRGGPEFIGFVGLMHPNFAVPFAPCVEVGWRLCRAAWGHGYATEAARASLDHGFEALRLAEIVSFTVPANVRSRAVMERLGMLRDPPRDFDHPRVPEGHALRRHVLYWIGANDRDRAR